MSSSFDNADQFTFSFEIGENHALEDGFIRLPLRGHLDADGAPVLTTALAALLESGHTRVELDCAEVHFISSTGIGSIVAAVGEYRDAGGDVVVRGLSEGLLGVFVSLDLLDYIVVR